MVDKKSYVGECIFFNPKTGWGFIGWRDDAGKPQKDMFLHFSDINCEGFKTIKKGQKVSFEIGQNKRNEPKAINVTIIDVQ